MRASLVYADKHRMAATSMTHDELLAKLSIPIILKAGIQDTDIVNLNLLVKRNQALRAVVELHKPQEITLPDGSWGQNCEYCDNYWGFCLTVMAIHKELL